MSGLALLLATLSVLAGTVTPTAAQSLTRGPVLIETHHTDLAGNIRLSTNEAGDVTQRLDYAPFGEVDGRSCTGDGDPTRSPQFQGKLRDPKTCLDDFGARDYYMVTGRFQSVDPVLPVETALRDPQQWNRYAYARNNPLIYTDPDGRVVESGWDYINVAMGVASLGKNLAAGNVVGAVVDGVGVVVDTAALLTPGAPGGFGTAIRTARAGDSVRKGQAAEAAVRLVADIGRKLPFDGASGKKRLADGFNRFTNTIADVKNVSYLALTSQIRDYVAYAKANNVTFELWLNEGAKVSKQLQEPIDNGIVIPKVIPPPLK